MRLEYVDIDADSDGLPGANSADGGHGAHAAIEAPPRQQLSRVLVHRVELPPDVIAKVDEGLIDVALASETRRLVLVLPRLDVHDGHARVQRVLKVL